MDAVVEVSELGIEPVFLFLREFFGSLVCAPSGSLFEGILILVAIIVYLDELAVRNDGGVGLTVLLLKHIEAVRINLYGLLDEVDTLIAAVEHKFHRHHVRSPAHAEHAAHLESGQTCLPYIAVGKTMSHQSVMLALGKTEKTLLLVELKLVGLLGLLPCGVAATAYGECYGFLSRAFGCIVGAHGIHIIAGRYGVDLVHDRSGVLSVDLNTFTT